MTKHTPGPWVAECVGDTGGENPTDVYEILADDRVRVAEYVSEGDAHLIAAAPDLLSVARGAEDVYSYLAATVQDAGSKRLAECLESFARAAIAKAEGR